MSGEVIILTGPPGAGKTTVAELVASDADNPTVHLTDFSGGLYRLQADAVDDVTLELRTAIASRRYL